MTFDERFINAFFRWGLIAHRFRAPLLILPFFLTAFLSVGFIWIKAQETRDPQYVFSPENARWQFEYRTLEEHWPLDESHFWPGKSYDHPGYIDVIAAAVPDPELGRPNMLVSKFINELDRINKYIIYNITVPVEFGNETHYIGYTDLCMTYEWKCYLNEHITLLQPKARWGTFREEVASLAEEIIQKEIKVTYPIGWRGTEPIYFGALVGGVHLSDAEGHFDYVRAVRLTFNTREETVGNVSFLWRQQVAHFLANKESPPSKILQFGFYHNESLPEGLQDVADTLTPNFALMSLILFVMCLAVSIVVLKHDNFVIGIDWVRSKPILGLAALVCPLLAVASAFGLVLWTGEYYNAIVNVSPFIVVCIGIDDAFLMSAAWHRTNPELSPARRLAETLAEAAVAISITSITDMLTFGIGCFTTLPGVRLFCLYTFWGITFTYLYQITYFTAVMAYAGEMEDRGLHALFGRRCMRPENADTGVKKWLLSGSVCRSDDRQNNTTGVSGGVGVLPPKNPSPGPVEDEINDTTTTSNTSANEKLWKEKLKTFFVNLETQQDDTDHHLDTHHGRETFVNWFFREFYGPELLKTKRKVAVLVLYLAYIFIALFGCSQIKEGLNPKNLVRRSFYLTDFYVLIDETFWQEGLQMQVVINNPPDLFDPHQRPEFDALLDDFEDTAYTMRHNATLLWLGAYEDALQTELVESNISLPTTSAEWYTRAREWLDTTGGRRLWELDMDWDDSKQPPVLRAFRFQLGLRNYRTPTDHTNSCKLMRQLAAKYSEFNVTTFHEYYPFADQYLELKPALFRNCFLAVVCMMLVSFLMIPHYGAAFAICACIISIDVGVLGCMALWGVNLESVSMITVIMSIGFSVDLSAHITYAYVKASGCSEKKAIQALETLGWPVFLGAFTTIIGIMVLTFVDAYIVLIFFKTIFLVIFFSLLHGIVFLPVLLTIMLPQAHIRHDHHPHSHHNEKEKAEEIQFAALRKVSGRILNWQSRGASVCDIQTVPVSDAGSLHSVDLSDRKVPTPPMPAKRHVHPDSKN